jgi:hypothetical protein
MICTKCGVVRTKRNGERAQLIEQTVGSGFYSITRLVDTADPKNISTSLSYGVCCKRRGPRAKRVCPLLRPLAPKNNF